MPEGPVNQESAILQPVAMHNSYGPFLRSFFARYFNPIRFPAEAIDKIKQLDSQGNIVYLARSANTLHFLYLNHLCIRHGLPLARFVNGIDPILMQPIGLLLERMRTLGSDSDEDLDEEGEHLPNRQLASVLAAGQASLLFLDKPATITSPGSPEHDGLLETLISSQQSQDKPIFLVPHLIFWDIHPEKESKALTDAVFGLPESPGFLRTMYLLLRYRRRAFVKVAEPINLLDFIKSQPDQNQANLAGSLQELVENKISLEVFDVTGPRIRRPAEFKQAILQDSKITELIESQGDNDEAKTEAFKKKAYDILDEIAAEPRIRWPIYLDKALNFFWSRMYDGIVVDEADFEKIRAAIRKAPVIFCPSHKSHVDYLILSQLCMKYAIPMPHIAAGENLAFWPMGPIFRHSGAFFMRRSFKGNPLYPVIFRTYLRYVMNEGFPIEFFIEGTRSRTGKLLSPRFGILTWLIEAFEEGAGQDVNFIPISIDYEKIAESRSYVKELSGSDKEKEDVASLVKSSSHLKSKSKYGKIYVQVGDPISFTQFVQKHNYDLKNLSKDNRRALVQEMAYTILYRINQVSTVTPSSLLAFSLLTHRRRGMSQEALEERAQWVVDWIRRRGHNRFSATLSDFPRALAEAAARFSRDGLIAMQHTGVELVYSPVERKRLALDYYRNNILHHFISASLCALALESFSVEAVPIDALRDRIKELSRLFKFEFLFRSVRDFETEVQNALKELAAEKAIKEEDGFIVKTNEAAQKLELFRAVIEHFVESYWLTAKSLVHLQKGPMFQKEFLSRALDLGDRLFVQGELNFFESMNREAIKNALLTFADRKIIEIGPTEKRKGPKLILLEPFMQQEKLDELAEPIRRYITSKS